MASGRIANSVPRMLHVVDAKNQVRAYAGRQAGWDTTAMRNEEPHETIRRPALDNLPK
jgi:hypothetical protein